MRLLLDTPVGWPGEGATLSLVGPRPRPCDLRPWLTEVIGGERVLDTKRLTTHGGWAFDLFLAVGKTARLVAIYDFGDHVAAAIVEGREIEGAAGILATARPDWRGDEVACLEELWTRP